MTGCIGPRAVAFRASVLALALGIAWAGCQDELPAVPPGGRIHGTVHYEGTERDSFGGTTLRVSAFPFWPPVGPPIAQQEFENPRLSPASPQRYELHHLGSQSTYFVVAQLIDHTKPLEQLPHDVPLGTYPSVCALGRDEGRVAVLEDRAVVDIDIEIFDAAGQDDPCVPVLCPDPGKASLLIEIAAPDVNVDEGDQLFVALFTQWPPPAGPPSAVQFVSGKDVSFPQQVLLANATPGSYAVYVCLDRGSDGAMGCTEEDVFAPYRGGELVAVEADTITGLAIQLEDGSGKSTPAPEDCSM